MERNIRTKSFARCRVISGSVLKVIALVTMFIDHTALWVLTLLPFAQKPLLPWTGTVTLVWLCRKIGRIAFPIYCFLITEGWRHTHDRIRYGCNLLLFALLSELPWNLLHSGTLQYEKQNVFFTLFLGFCCIAVYERFLTQRGKMLAGLLALLLLAMLLNADYGIRGMALILLLHLLREERILQGILGCCFLNEGAATLPAFLLTGLYNGQRGFIRGKLCKYLFYAFYPLHLLLLYLVRSKLGGF